MLAKSHHHLHVNMGFPPLRTLGLEKEQSAMGHPQKSLVLSNVMWNTEHLLPMIGNTLGMATFIYHHTELQGSTIRLKK